MPYTINSQQSYVVWSLRIECRLYKRVNGDQLRRVSVVLFCHSVSHIITHSEWSLLIIMWMILALAVYWKPFNILWGLSQQTQNNCITFVQCWTNADVVQILYNFVMFCVCWDIFGKSTYVKMKNEMWVNFMHIWSELGSLGKLAEDDEMNQVTLLTRHNIWNSSPLPLGHRCSSQSWVDREHFVSLMSEDDVIVYKQDI